MDPLFAAGTTSLGALLGRFTTAIVRHWGSVRQTETPMARADEIAVEAARRLVRPRLERLALLRSLHAECTTCEGIGCAACAGTGLA